MSENNVIRVSIADDQELVRAGFAMVIGSQPDMEVVGQAADGHDAVRVAAEARPDVVLMDVRMPGMDGIEATRRITALAADGGIAGADGIGNTSGDGAARPVKVIILTTFDLDEYVMAAIDAGASGFLLKDTEPETLLSAIRTVFRGDAVIAPSATKRLIEKMMRDGYAGAAEQTGGTVAGGAGGVRPAAAGAGPSPGYTDPELALLTDREREVLVEIAHGLSNQEIARELFVSVPTVKTHVAHILAKINARDRVQAVVFAYENGLV